jgi:hypothetical protein
VINGSAFPQDVDELFPAAVDLAIADDQVPSVNRLRTELRVGYEKARQLHQQLTERAERWDEVAVETAGPSDPRPLDEPLVEQATQPQVTAAAEPARPPARKIRIWPLIVLAAPAFVSIWAGWVGLGGLTGFGPVHLLPGIADGFVVNSAITLPIGMETYAAYALRIWLTPGVPRRARRFAMWSSIGALLLGAAGQVAYHLMVAPNSPWLITTVVACLPVAVLGMGAALTHLLRNGDTP